jgi:molecular chaperone IbpA
MTNNITLRSFDLAPFRRFGVGFDRMFEEFEKNFDRASAQGYPPFNLERTSENEYRITMAVAGFTETEIDVTVKDKHLVVEGKKEADENEAEKDYIHKGIANRSFSRSFLLSENVSVKTASLADGMLVVDLEHIVPEELKPRKIPLIKG